MAASPRYTKLRSSSGCSTFPKAAVIQGAVGEERLRSQDISKRRYRVWWHPLHPLGCTGWRNFDRAIPCSNPARQRNGIIQKTVALVAQQSGSGAHERRRCRLKRRTSSCESISSVITESLYEVSST